MSAGYGLSTSVDFVYVRGVTDADALDTVSALADKVAALIPGSRSRRSKRDHGYIVKTPGSRRDSIVVRLTLTPRRRIDLSWQLPQGDTGQTVFALSQPEFALRRIKRVLSGETYVRFERVFTPARRRYLEQLAALPLGRALR